MQRRLAALLVADVVGYSRLLEADEAGTLAALRARRKAVLEPAVKAHSGRIVKLMGDGALVEFASAVNALSCALAVQEGMAVADAGLEVSRRIQLRIGLSLGEVIGEGSDIYGEGVNVAARLEALDEPGGICISGKLREEVRGKFAARFDDLGERTLKNMAQPVRVFRVLPAPPAQQAAPELSTTVPPRASRLPGHSIAVRPLYPRGMTKKPNPFRYFKTSPEIIRLAVMMHTRFPLSLRNVEDLLHERGIDVSWAAIRCAAHECLLGGTKSTVFRAGGSVRSGQSRSPAERSARAKRCQLASSSYSAADRR